MGNSDWKPGADLEVLATRARVNRQIRAFFEERGVLEVETPVLGAATVTDVNLESLRVSCRVAGQTDNRYLQTSPEFAMKRLLAAGCGPIYQICKAFRDAEAGRSHNPEFTILEWYRPGFDHHQLMDELDSLIQLLLDVPSAERITYRQAMQSHADLDCTTVTVDTLRTKTHALGVRAPALGLSLDDYLDLVLTHSVQPALPTGPVFIYDFPASQAALARIREDDPPVAERFELFVNGIEVANGYHELTDPAEQRRRFEHDLALRAERDLPTPAIDEHFLEALAAGIPACSGVALGLDRILMIATGKSSLAEVLTFPWAGA